MNTEAIDHWTDYWQSGDALACTREFSADAHQQIATAWKSEFSRLESGARLLDLATGNGALLTHIPLAIGHDVNDIEATGIDLSDIEKTAPQWLPKAPRVKYRLHGGLDLVALPFEDQSFDLVVSQFGAEYAGLEDAITEAWRLTCDKLVMLVHAADGVVVRQNGDIARQTRFIMEKVRIIDRLRNCHLNRNDKTIAAFGEGVQLIQQEAERVENPSFLNSVLQQLDQYWQNLTAYPANFVTNAIDELDQRLVGHGHRMAALGKSAWTGEALAGMLEGGKSAWSGKGEIMPQYADAGSSLVGYWIRIAR